MKKRAAFTLIEMLTAITLLAAVMATVALALHSMYQAESRMQSRTENANSIDRLASRLRSDAHASEAASIKEDDGTPSLSLLQYAGRRVLYTPRASGIERSVFAVDELKHRDVFRLSKAEVAWEIRDTGVGQLVTLRTRLSGARHGVRSRHEIKAAIGIMHEATREPKEAQP